MPRWRYIPDRLEFVCEHGVGHPAAWSPNGVHGCDGCCSAGQFPGRAPSVGDLALCGAGSLGVITKAEKVRVTYPDGTTALAWTGIHLSGALKGTKPGDPWSSRNPCIVGNLLYLPTKVDLDWADDVWQTISEQQVEQWPRLFPKKFPVPLAHRKVVNQTIMRVLRDME